MNEIYQQAAMQSIESMHKHKMKDLKAEREKLEIEVAQLHQMRQKLKPAARVRHWVRATAIGCAVVTVVAIMSLWPSLI